MAPWPPLPAPTVPRPGSSFQNITTTPSQPTASHRRFCIGHLTASPQPTLQPEATRMGSCTIQNPLGVPRDLRIRPQVPYHGLKGSRGPAPTSGSQAPVRKLQLWPLRLPRGLCTHWRPNRCRGRIRLTLSASFLSHHKHTSLPAFAASPTLCRRRPVPSQGCPSEAESASGRRAAACCPSHTSNRPHRAQDSSCRVPLLGPRRAAPPV